MVPPSPGRVKVFDGEEYFGESVYAVDTNEDGTFDPSIKFNAEENAKDHYEDSQGNWLNEESPLLQLAYGKIDTLNYKTKPLTYGTYYIYEIEITNLGKEIKDGKIKSSINPFTNKEEYRVKYFGIQIVGGGVFVEATIMALNALKKASYLDHVRTYLWRIQEFSKSGVHTTDKYPTFQVGEKVWNTYTSWYASNIVHDSMHVYLYRNGYQYEGAKAETYCLRMQLLALSALGDNRYDSWLLQNVDNPTYQNIPYEDRYW